MSQHSCISEFTTLTGKKVDVDVLMGWDRPLQRHFLVVEILDPDLEVFTEEIPESLRGSSNLEGEGILYSNLIDSKAAADLDYYVDKLKELKIAVPDSMIEGCRVDKENNDGDREEFHEFDN